jgi:hypothetical protein
MFAPITLSLTELRASRDAESIAVDLLGRYAAIRVPDAVSTAESVSLTTAVLAARASWTPNFGSKQFTLGRSYYTHLEEDREEEYFDEAATSDETVRRLAPGLQERMLSFAGSVLGRVIQRRGWCGPGVHIFPARGEVARRGGEVHFDTEGLSPEQIARRAPAVSMVLMLRPPLGGGGLRIWDRLFDGNDFPNKPDPSTDVTQIASATGDLVVFDSYRLHQILSFHGTIDRISVTLHACLEGGAWQVWF